MTRKFHLLLGTLLVGVLLFAAVAPQLSAKSQASAAVDQPTAVTAALNWLVNEAQNDDGGYGTDYTTGEPASAVSSTLDAVIAIASTGYDPAQPTFGNATTPIDYLSAESTAMSEFAASSGGSAGKVVIALATSNQNARAFAGSDWVQMLLDQYDSNTGSYNTTTPFLQSLAMVALATVNEPIPAAAVDNLTASQADDGSWDDGFGTLQNPDATAMAIMALLAADVSAESDAIVDAVAFLADAQLPTGGWEYGSGYGENANSTALVVQALSALGEDFVSAEGAWAKEGMSPLDVLFSYQSTTGAFQFYGADDFYATAQSLPAATGRPYPLPSRYEAAISAVSCLATLQDPSTGGWEQFAGFGVNAAGTSRAIQAIASAGGDPQSDFWTPGSVNAVEALESMTPDYLADGRGGRVGTVTQGVVAAGAPYDPTDFAGFDLPAEIKANLDENGTYADTGFGPFAQGEAMLGLIETGNPVAQSAIDVLWNFNSAGDFGGTDSNGMVLNVFGRLGMGSPATYSVLKASQLADGGWGFSESASPSSTSEAVQGLIQQGENPFGPDWSVVVDGELQSPADAVLAKQGDDGCWPNEFGPGNDPFGTTDAIILLSQTPEWGSASVMMPMVISD